MKSVLFSLLCSLFPIPYSLIIRTRVVDLSTNTRDFSVVQDAVVLLHGAFFFFHDVLLFCRHDFAFLLFALGIIDDTELFFDDLPLLME